MIGHLMKFLLFFGSVLVSCSRYPHRHYYYINTLMTWAEAQQYCRQHYDDLATFESMEEVQQHDSHGAYSWAWIGLFDDPSSWRGVMGKELNSWRWSATGETSQSGYQIWSSGEPNYRNRFETCVMMDAGRVWHDKDCNTPLGFVCFTESDQSQVLYNYISTPSTWSAAQTYCRLHHTDLAVIESSSQNTDVYNSITPRANAWIGLYRVPWIWSDHTLSSFRNWDQVRGSPNFPYEQHVVASDGKLWDDDKAEVGYGPLCQRVSVLQTSVRVNLQSSADLTLSENNALILQKVDAELKRRGWTGFRLNWRIKPVKRGTEVPTQP